jgi:hypothetical protein
LFQYFGIHIDIPDNLGTYRLVRINRFIYIYV